MEAKYENFEKELKRIASSVRLPIYSDILRCLDIILNNKLTEKEECLIRIIFKRASINNSK